MAVYVIQCSKTEAIKIGYTENPQKRLQALQTSNPYPLKLLYLLKGDKGLEKYFHNHFSDYRIKGEWFTGEMCSSLIEIIESSAYGTIQINDICSINFVDQIAVQKYNSFTTNFIKLETCSNTGEEIFTDKLELLGDYGVHTANSTENLQFVIPELEGSFDPEQHYWLILEFLFNNSKEIFLCNYDSYFDPFDERDVVKTFSHKDKLILDFCKKNNMLPKFGSHQGFTLSFNNKVIDTLIGDCDPFTSAFTRLSDQLVANELNLFKFVLPFICHSVHTSGVAIATINGKPLSILPNMGYRYWHVTKASYTP